MARAGGRLPANRPFKGRSPAERSRALSDAQSERIGQTGWEVGGLLRGGIEQAGRGGFDRADHILAIQDLDPIALARLAQRNLALPAVAVQAGAANPGQAQVRALAPKLRVTG